MDRIVLPASEHPALSVVVLATRDGDRFRRCLGALAAGHDPAVETEVVLVLNAAAPDVLAAADHVVGARVLSSSVDLGTAASWNRAVDRARGAHVAIVHEDARVGPGWASALLAAFDDPVVGVAGAEMRHPDGSVQNRGWVTFADGTVWAVGTEPAPPPPAPAPVPVDGVSTATLVVDRALWSAIGGFDERTFPAVGVDPDLGLSAWHAGRRVVHVPTSWAYHDTAAMVDDDGGPATSWALRDMLIERAGTRLAAKWADQLVDHLPRPEAWSLDAVAAALARTAARSARLDARPQAMPPGRSERPITGGLADVAAGAPAAMEQRAADARAELLDELGPWTIARYHELRGTAANWEDTYRELGRAHGALYEAHAALVEEHARLVDEQTAAVAELAAIRTTRSWRVRARVLGTPLVGQALQALARRTRRGEAGETSGK